MHLKLATYLVLSLCLSAFIAFVLLPGIVRLADVRGLYDHPDKRKVHVGRVPRLGGMAFLPSILLSLSVVFTLAIPSLAGQDVYPSMKEVLLACSGALVLYITGIADDLVGVRYRWKFAVQFLAALTMCLSGVWINDLHGIFGIHALPAWAGMPLTILVVVSIINSMNLIDGIDGLASGLCIMGLSAFTFLFLRLGLYIYAFVGVAALGCLLVFYGYNVFGTPEKHNKIFMGDTGALFMGFIMAFFAVKVSTLSSFTSTESTLYFVYSYSIFLLPLLDMVRVFFNRIKMKRNPFLPDKTHIHHKFLALDFSQRQARWIIFAISVMYFFANILMSDMGVNINIILGIDVLIWCAFHMLVTRQIMKHYENPGVTVINTDLIKY